ncbi:Acyl-CoA--sterol O-acyltransferase 1 [Tetrabaena socialis]|uniref:Acyl-CoA--sterol O-acyltransferase 1 n=1 Tax=Tetrabaena socialis TaxID=47790 RepID=A0A2J8A6Z1_9CHLO|nr:Acyl-CoA--sterol O-acyltransferase 1 [Tetrabaena socialis]|eukprot:PNH08288.1 Acyl-CoA--sterol O-acyltransferase 1 [Tetrabaena socialis]
MKPPFIDVTALIPQNLRFAALSLIFILLAVWLKLVVARLPLGVSRFLGCLPLLVAGLCAPYIFSEEEILPRTSALFILSWLGNFKVLAFCLGREPLRESMTVAQIAATLLLPIFPKAGERGKGGPEGRVQDSAGSGAGFLARWVGKLGARCPVTQSNMNCSPSRWCGRSQRTSMLSTTTSPGPSGQPGGADHSTSGSTPSGSSSACVLLGAVVFAEVDYRDALPLVAVHYLHAFGLYAFVGFLQDGPAAVAVEALGLQLGPTFDQPWLSSSLADFWARRWNIPTATCLRTLVYDPIVDGALIAPAWRRASPGEQAEGEHAKGREPPAPVPAQAPGQSGSLAQQPQLQPPVQGSAVRARTEEQARAAPRPSMLRRQLGVHAVFLVSGLVHEYIAWNVSGAGWGWKWTLFFYIQAPLMTAEGLGRRLLSRVGVWRLPRLLTTLLTLVLLEVTAYDLFFGFVDRDTDMAQRVLVACMQGYSAALRPLAPLLEAAAAAASAGWKQ